MIEQAKEAIEGSIEEALKASKAATDSILKDQMEQVSPQCSTRCCCMSATASIFITLSNWDTLQKIGQGTYQLHIRLECVAHQ